MCEYNLLIFQYQCNAVCIRLLFLSAGLHNMFSGTHNNATQRIVKITSVCFILLSIGIN